MANVTVKNLPDELYERIKARAGRHRRSINSEIIVCLEEAMGMIKPSTEEVRERLEALRGRVRPRRDVDVDEIVDWIRGGREGEG